MSTPQIIPIPSRKPTDPWVAGPKYYGWKVTDASKLTANQTLTADVVIIGTGAGGGITAEMLALSGLKVLIIEEGGLQSSTNFNMKESDAYPGMYQENLARRSLRRFTDPTTGQLKTEDGGVGIMQGRTVGGGTVVNWATSFRTPPQVLQHWVTTYGLTDLSESKLAPWFAAVEKRMSIKRWGGALNGINSVLQRGLSALGMKWDIISPNVKGCANLGYCGLGCPINAKQSTLVANLPVAMAKGARLYHRLRARNFTFNASRTAISSLVCDALDPSGLAPSGRTVTITARHYVLAGGAINSPGLLLRSKKALNDAVAGSGTAIDPHNTLGKRTFLHASASVGGFHPGQIKAWEGLPQSVYSDQFLDDKPLTGALGWKLEVAPVYPAILGASPTFFGDSHLAMMKAYEKYCTVISFMRDGFNADSPGGEVFLRPEDNFSAAVDYTLTPGYLEAVRKAIRSQGQVQFAAGATRVLIGHLDANPQGYTSFADFSAALDSFQFVPGRVRLNSAHQMGGCGMSADPTKGVVNQNGRHHQITNLSVHDSSIFPTGLGTNPQETIFGLTARNTAKLALDI